MAPRASHDLLTPAEVAKRLRMSRESVYRRIADGSLRAYRVGEFGPLRVPADAVDEILRPTERAAA